MPAAFAPAPLARLRRPARLRRLDDPTLTAPERLARAKSFLAFEKRRQLRDHRRGADGLSTANRRADTVDTLLGCLWRAAVAAAGGIGPGEATLVALGGYGRGELCPHSDIDLLILYSSRLAEDRLATLRTALTDGILYPLWDLGFKVGHASRTITETLEEARANIVSKIALLETRHIAGDPGLFADFGLAIAAEVRTPGFARDTVKHLLDEQERRREKHGDSVFLQEPEVKNGVGGLRDLHTLVWLARILHDARGLRDIARRGWLSEDDAARLDECRSFLLRVRNELHFSAPRPTDLLTLEKQPVIAEHLGYAETDWVERVERFMRDYYAAAEFIWRTVREAEWRLERPSAGKSFSLAAPRAKPGRDALRTEAFIIENGLVEPRDPGVFDEDPVLLLRVFHHAQRVGAALSPSLARLIREKAPLLTPEHAFSPAAHKAFLAILAEAGRVHPALNAMRDHGVLTRYLPEFAPMICLVQHELYHRYTADIHTLLCIRELDAIFSGDNPAADAHREALFDCEDPSLLYLLLLLHDIGKPIGIKGHAEFGVRVAAPFLDRIGVTGERRALVETVIRTHLDMSAFWQRHDVEDPAMIARFAEKIPDPEALRFLFVHTYCDARGTAQGLWNSYKDSLHTRLYRNTLARLRGVDLRLDDPAPLRDAIVAESDTLGYDTELDRTDVITHLGMLPPRYLRLTDAPSARLHARLVNRLILTITRAEGTESLMPAIDWADDLATGMAVITLVSWDRPGLFYRVCGAFALAGLSIHATRAFARDDGLALDIFQVTEADGSPPADSRRDRFLKFLHDSLVDGKDHTKPLADLAERSRRARTAMRRPRPPKVEIEADPELHRTVVELRATDRLGLLHDLGRIFFEHRRDIAFARIATESGYARDTFYLTPFEHDADPTPDQNESLRAALLASIGE